MINEQGIIVLVWSSIIILGFFFVWSFLLVLYVKSKMI